MFRLRVLAVKNSQNRLPACSERRKSAGRCWAEAPTSGELAAGEGARLVALPPSTSLALVDVNLETTLGKLGAEASDASTEDGDNLRKRTFLGR